MRIAITRALPEAEATAARVAARGGEPVVAPLLRIEPLAFDKNVAGLQALVFSSANGVRAFAQDFAQDFAGPVFTVGDATAAAARAAGLTDVHSADGDVTALTGLVTRSCTPAGGRILHISGAQIAGDIVGTLRAAGFDAERRVAYQAVASTDLPAPYRTRLDVVLFHSAPAVEIFARFGAPNAADMKAACLSAAIAAQAARTPWKQVVAAERPREDALLAAALAPTEANA